MLAAWLRIAYAAVFAVTIGQLVGTLPLFGLHLLVKGRKVEVAG